MASAFSTWLRARIDTFFDTAALADHGVADAETALASDLRGHLGRLIAEAHQLKKEDAAIAQEADALALAPEAAIEAGEETLARAALKRLSAIADRRAEIALRLMEIDHESRRVDALLERIADETGLHSPSRLAEDLSRLVSPQRAAEKE